MVGDQYESKIDMVAQMQNVGLVASGLFWVKKNSRKTYFAISRVAQNESGKWKMLRIQANFTT